MHEHWRRTGVLRVLFEFWFRVGVKTVLDRLYTILWIGGGCRGVSRCVWGPAASLGLDTVVH